MNRSQRFEYFRDVLRDIQAERSRLQWFDPETGMPAWMGYEVYSAWLDLNSVRFRYGKNPLPIERVRRAEQMASGHVDYTKKFALYLAELAEED